MKHFYTYDGRGNIVTSGICQDEHFENHAMPGLTLVEGHASAKAHYLLNGELLCYSDEQKAAKAYRPPGAAYWDNTTMSWVMQPGAAWAAVRFRRDMLLSASDWRVSRAVEQGVPLDPAWAAYRQALRDVTLQPDPDAVVWPTPPA